MIFFFNDTATTEIYTEHSMHSKHHVEFLNIKPDGT
jgi:hypothetical protein